MKENLIIVNHIGTSVVEAINQELSPLVNDVKKLTTGEVLLAFSSRKAIAKLLQKGIKVPHVEDVVKNSIENYSIKILPTHLVGGDNYFEIENFINNNLLYEGNIQLVKPLLSNEENIKIFVNIINTLIRDNKSHILFVGHGTTHASNIYYDYFIEEYKKINENISFITLKTPTKNISGDILIFPLFTVQGHHLTRDIYSGEKSIYNCLNKENRKVDCFNRGLLAIPEIRKLYIEQLRSALWK